MDWTSALQKELGAQEELVGQFHISVPASPVREAIESEEERQANLAKSQLSFIDIFAAPLWKIGAESFFPGMRRGLTQIAENRQAWNKLMTDSINKVDGMSSFSTITSAMNTNGGKNDGVGLSSAVTADNSRAEASLKNVSCAETDESDLVKRMKVRKQRSLSGFRFWRWSGGKHQDT
jgi:hypothetical protein